MLTGPLLIVVFLLSVVVLLVTILKFKLNAFVALLLTAIATAVFVRMPVSDIGTTVSAGFGSTLAGIGIVTGLGVMLGSFMFESGGIEVMANTILKKFGEKRTPEAVALSGFITGIPVFGDVVYIMFAPMLRVLSKKTGVSMVAYACSISIATTATYAMVIPTPAPLAVSESLKIDVGVFFIYSIVCAFIATMVAGVWYAKHLDKVDHKNNHTYSFDDLEVEDKKIESDPNKKTTKFYKIAFFTPCSNPTYFIRKLWYNGTW